MKSSVRLLVIYSAVSLLVAPAIAAEENEPPAPFKIAGKTSRAFQKYSGITWLTERLLELSANTTAKVVLGGKPRTRLRLYSATDAFAGKLKSFEVRLHDCEYKDVPLADLKLESATPIAYRFFGKRGLVSPIMLKVQGSADEKQITQALKSPKITNSLNFLKFKLPGLGEQTLQVQSPEVDLENGQVHINAFVITEGADRSTGVPIDVKAKPVLESQRFIVLKDTKLSSPDIVEPEKFAEFTEDLLNPLIDFGRMDRHTHAFRLTNLDLNERQVSFSGNLLLAPKPVSPTSGIMGGGSGSKPDEKKK